MTVTVDIVNLVSILGGIILFLLPWAGVAWAIKEEEGTASGPMPIYILTPMAIFVAIAWDVALIAGGVMVLVWWWLGS